MLLSPVSCPAPQAALPPLLPPHGTPPPPPSPPPNIKSRASLLPRHSQAQDDMQSEFGLEGCWEGGQRGADVHGLVPLLEGLVLMESTERVAR